LAAGGCQQVLDGHRPIEPGQFSNRLGRGAESGAAEQMTGVFHAQGESAGGQERRNDAEAAQDGQQGEAGHDTPS